MKKTHSWNKSVRLLSWLAGALLLTAFTVSCKANVSTPIAVSGVTLDKATVILVEQETVTLKVTVKPEKATNKAVTWSSNKADVAAVDKDGKVTAHKAGEAVITVKSEDGGKTASCKVTVTAKAPPTPTYAVSFSVDGTGGTLKAKADGVTETDKSPISVEKDKTVTFTAKPADGYEVEKWTVNGTAVANNVSTTYSHKVTEKIEVKVSFKALPPATVAVTGVTLNKSALTLEEGKSEQLKATVKPANATNKAVKWSSDKSVIASVDANGRVTAHKAGEATITVTTEDGTETASCTVTVTLTEYAITYNLDGGSHSGNPANYTIETETITLKDASKANYTFAGWYEKADFTGEKVTQIVKGSTGNKELWAKFLENYSITYHLNDGMNDSGNPASYTVETETITLKPAEKADHIFFGWYASADFSGEKVTEIRKGSSGNKELYAKFIEMKMIDIAAVTNGTLGHANYGNNREHTVSLTAYRIGETEVTQDLWQAVMGTNPSDFSSSPASGEVQGKRPVENVSWYHAIAFCNKLSIACSLEPCYTVSGVNFATLGFNNIPTSNDSNWNNAVCDWSKNGFRLPTEAEWEWAAMGGTTDKWAGTNTESELGTYAWYNDSKTHEVKKKQANGYGLYDMSGNVAEWCWDWYSSSTPSGGQSDPTGAVSGFNRVERGGSWKNVANGAARAFRVFSNPGYRSNFLGLRVACRP